MRFVADVVESGSAAELGLYAPAMAYSLVVSLAPLTLALRYVGARIIAANAFPGSPLSGANLTTRQIAGQAFMFAGPFGILIGTAFVLFAASALFTGFVSAIHRIWGDESAQGLAGSLLTRGIALVLLIAMGLGLLVSSVLGNVALQLAGLVRTGGGYVGVALAWVVTLASGRIALDFVFSAVLFAVAFRVVPARPHRMRHMLPGVLLTAAAYAVGQQVLGVYLRHASHAGVLGAFGQFVAFLLWAYYTALTVLWGAELSFQVARRLQAKAESSTTRPHKQTRPVVQ